MTRKKKWIRRKSSGFTLMEMIIVIMIIATLAVIIIPNVMGRGQDAKDAAAKASIRTGLGTAIDIFYADTGQYPAQLEDLIVDPGLNNWKGPYLKNQSTVPLDPWGNPYFYVTPGANNETAYDLSSAGQDGKTGTDDDITNW